MNEELGKESKDQEPIIITKPIELELLHHMDHGKAKTVLIAGSHDSESHIHRVASKIGKIGNIVIPPFPISTNNNDFHKKMQDDFKKEINLLNNMLPVPQKGTNRQARRKKRKK